MIFTCALMDQSVFCLAKFSILSKYWTSIPKYKLQLENLILLLFIFGNCMQFCITKHHIMPSMYSDKKYLEKCAFCLATSTMYSVTKYLEKNLALSTPSPNSLQIYFLSDVCMWKWEERYVWQENKSWLL